METVGIIAEYNPFHNGHLHHINETKKLFPNAMIILILNGYFLQRGELSLLCKEEKTRIALHYDISLIIELPFVFGSQSADTFAYNSVKLLDTLQCEKIVFGSECNDAGALCKAAAYQINNKEYEKTVKEYMDKGVSYPTATAKASKENISAPNDLLGVSYIKAILKLNSKMKYFTIQRTNNYHDKVSNAKIVSATNIREQIKNNKIIEKYVPKYPITINWNLNTDYFNLLKHKIITDKDLTRYLTVDEGIENRLKKFVDESSSLDQFIGLIKTKRYTYNKINRMFIHILIGLTKEDNKYLELDYIKVLGFDEIGKKYLNSLKKDIAMPISTKNLNSKVLDYERKASAIYDLITNKNTLEFENENKPILK